MRRKEPPITATSRGKSLIATRTQQQQQRRLSGGKTQLPRSFSTPPSQNEPPQKGYVMRSFSSPEPKQTDYRRNSDSFYRPKSHGSRSELDSDLENFEQFEEGFLDIDAEDFLFTPYRSSEEPKRVLTTLLPGSGLQRVAIRPVTTTQTLQGAREAMKQLQKKEHDKGRQNFRPLSLKMPTHHGLQDPEPSSPVFEELQTSPQLELEGCELDRELDDAEQHLARGVAMATEESDADTVSGRV